MVRISKTQVVTKLKMWHNSKTQVVTKLKLWQNSNCDKTQVVFKLKNSKCDKTLIATKTNKEIKLGQKLNLDEAQFMRGRKNFKGILVRQFWHLDTQWDVFRAARECIKQLGCKVNNRQTNLIITEHWAVYRCFYCFLRYEYVII